MTMTRTRGVVAWVAAVIVSLAGPGAAGAQPSDVIRDRDAYVVYAAVLPLRSGDHPPPAIAISQQTRGGLRSTEGVPPGWQSVC